VGQAATASAYSQNLYDKNAEWGPCYYDVTHILASSAVYELPIGRTRRWGKNLHPVVHAMIADWRVGAIVQLHGGFPLTILANDVSGTNSRGSRANCLAPPHIFGRKPALDPSNGRFMGFQWFDPASYGPAVPGTFGTCGVGTVRGPGLSTADLSIQKEFPLSELKRLEFRAELFNATNKPIFDYPANLTTSNMLWENQSEGARNIQFALKFRY
jgi:hypothetical protein